MWTKGRKRDGLVAPDLPDVPSPCFMKWLMIIACPACSTRYAVPDSSIGVDGRVVRCAKCRESWFQDGPELAEPGADTPAVPAQPQPAPVTDAPEGTAVAPVSVPAAALASQTAPLSPIEASPPNDYADLGRARDFAETPSSFAHEPPFRPRRHRPTAWLIAAVLCALVVLTAIGVMARFGVPDWLPLPHGALAGAEGTFAEVGPNLILDFPQGRQERRRLPNGNDFFNVSGSIHNFGKTRRSVPTLIILLRDRHNNIVYSLETASPKPVLAPGESETVNQAIIDAPSSARSAEIGWKPR